MDTHAAPRRRQKVWLDADAGDFDDFKRQVQRTTEGADYPYAAAIEKNIPVYDGALVRKVAVDREERRALMAEWVHVFDNGPGAIAIKQAIADTSVVDRATEVFDGIIMEERRTGAGAGDHFAKPGANDRVWNALEKHCLADPENFSRYYASDGIAMASEAWLGRGYQVTSQVNRVNPGGEAQTPHRDYHLGFMEPRQMEAFPAHVHGLSPLLTLQGAVAHLDMPIESGPTMLLPYTQTYFEGYLSFGREEFQRYFAEHHVQLALEKGDAAFFNPALMHGAGNNNTSDVFRMANLLQVGSAFGRSIETVDRARMVTKLQPVLARASIDGSLNSLEIANVIAASAEGYAFPTNLDRDPPVDGLTPKTQAELLADAVRTGSEPAKFAADMAAWAERRLS